MKQDRNEQRFVSTVWEFYSTSGRNDLPWRHTTDPYQILVSEVMLQQTQVQRVVPKYQAFIEQWGSVSALAEAPLGEVLIAWQGLGYNRRAKALHACAREVVLAYNGHLPSDYERLLQLPGIGPYTAGAVLAFAFNQAVPIIETNIRRVYLYHFFTSQTKVTDRAITQKIIATMDRKNPREWYWALMDYGAYLKKQGQSNQQAQSYQKQTPFAGSDRQIRGAIIRELSIRKLTYKKLHQTLGQYEKERFHSQLAALEMEGLVQRSGRQYRLPI